MVDLVVDSMTDKKIRFIRGNGPSCIEKGADAKLNVFFWTNGFLREEKYDTVLYAIGREVGLHDLKLENAGISTTQGKIDVDDYSQTSVPSIFAVGDCVRDKSELASTAIKAGRTVARNLFTAKKERISYDFIGRTLLTPAEFSTVGLSEEAANATYGSNQIECFIGTYEPVELLVNHRSTRHCFLKAIAMREGDQKIIGLHLIGPNAGEVIQGYAVALKCGLTMTTLKDAVGIHPTVAQEFIRLTTTKRSETSPQRPSCCS